MILALLLMVAMPMMAERVSPETARKVATTFLNNNGAKSAQLTDLSKAAGFANLYIFNAEQSFVVMAADDCVRPILGYSLTGEFVAENMPSNVRGWLQGYNDEIQYAIDNQIRATNETTRMWKELVEGNAKAGKATVVVAPLIQTKWNQGTYYNDLCPAVSDGPNGHAHTGCVATAMAQIMKYWSYPSIGVGSHSYSWNGQTLSADFGATTYDWANMKNYYEYYYVNGTDQYAIGVSSPSAEEITAVATLMYHCGVSVEMEYGGQSTGGSGASTSFVAKALKTFFNYSPNIEFLMKNQYDDDIWITMVKNELNHNRPLEYSGQDPDPYGGGHAFVCDGYNSDNYFHFNWGWSGHYDGYFSLDNLNTGANNESGSGNGVYTDMQGAVFGIQPVQCAASDPTNLTYTLNGLQDVTLSWAPANGAVSYNIYRNNFLVGNATEPSYTEAAPFGTNVYYVRSVDANGIMSFSSNTVTVTIDYLTPIVDDLAASLSENNVDLTWSAPEWCYPETPSSTLTYGNQNNSGANFSFGSDLMYWGHRHLAENLSACQGLRLYSVVFHAFTDGNYELCIYEGTRNRNGYTVPVSKVYTQAVTVSSSGWNTVDLETPYYINSNQDLWVFMHNTEPFDNLQLFLCTADGDYGAYYSNTPLSHTHNNAPGYAFLIKAYLTDDTYTYNLYQDGTSIAQNLSQISYNATLHNNAANVFTVRTNYSGSETEDSNKVGFTKGIASLGSLEMASNDKMTVTENSTLTVSGTLSNSNPEHLILEDGAQLINGSEGVKATVKKHILPYSEDKQDGWNLIASPVTEDITPTIDNGILSSNYDLYYFDQSGTDDNGKAKEWRNFEALPDSKIEHKTGYLYANSDETTLSFAGTLAGSGSTATLTLDANADFSGFNLIGNPYPCNAYANKPFYVLQYNQEENNTSFVPGSNPIPPCSAILVQAQNDGETVSFSKTPIAEPSSIVMHLSEQKLRSNTTLDEARISCEEQCQLTKYTWGKAASTIYIPQNGQDLAVACANGQNEMPLNFKAAKNSTYTLDFKVENMEADYLHLIDNITGANVDLLATPSYSFEGKTDDYESRFKLVFSNHEDANDNNVHFAYYADGEIRLVETCHGASLQVVDMMGRVVLAGDAMNRVSTNGMTAGVYVLRLINGNDVKTQKIVIE